MQKQDKEALIVAALEGGINYWCYEAKPENKEKFTEGFLSEHFAAGNSIILVEDEDDTEHVLSHERFMEGLKMAKNHFEYRSNQELIDEHDAEVADCLIQFAIFGELVYG